MTKTQAKKKIKELIDEYEGIKKRSEIGLYNEETTKQRFIQPLFKALGWDFKVDVWLEEKVSKGRVDYAFKLNNITKFFVETKSLKVGLDNPDYDKQVINYGWLKDITWVVLTNFERLKIFNSELKEESLVLDLTYDRYLKDFDDLWRLSKEAFIKGELDRWAEKYGKKAKRLKVGEQLFEDLMEWRKFLFGNASLFLNLSKEEISEGVQKILDRLIFIRTAEDRGIEEKILLPKLREWEDKGRQQEFMEILSKIFRDFDKKKGYDSDLFAFHDCENWKLGTEVLEKVVEGLYKTKDDLDYDFSAIDSDTLGGIYEQYLGHLLEMRKGEVKVINGHAKRKEKGIYYTPKFIVDYIVKNTLGEVLKNKKPNEIRELKVLDPACGSGSFLQRAYQEIADCLEGKKSEVKDEKSKLGAIAKLMKEKEGRKELSMAQKIDILRNNIYGVDLDHQAVEIARLNLLLKVLKKRQRLPLLDDTIKEGNSLISGDEKELKKYFGDRWKEKKPFNWEEEFEEVFERGGFDVIIGNPPWVTLLQEEIGQGELKYFKEKYLVAGGFKLNLFPMFVEKALRLLKQNGVLSFIIPNRLLDTPSYRSLIKEIIENFRISFIVDIPEGSFEDVVAGNIIICIQRAKPLKNIKIYKNIFTDKNKKEIIEVGINQIIKNDYVINLGFNKNLSDIFYKIEKSAILLKDLANIHVGMMIKNKKEMLKLEDFSNSNKIVVGRDFDRYIKFKNRFFRPNEVEIFGGTKNLVKHLTCPKLLVRKTGNKLVAWYDNEGIFAEQSVYLVLPQNVNVKFLMALINSKLLTFYFRNNLITNPESYPYIQHYDLEKIPIYKIDFSDKVEKAKHDKLVVMVDKILKLNKELQKFGGKITDKRKKIEKEIEKMDRKIDDIVHKLYGLTKKEIKIVKGG